MSDSRIQPLNRACVSPSPPLEERVGQGCGQSRSAGFQTCCIAGLPACGRAEISEGSSLATRCRLEIGDTAGLETCATLELADFVNHPETSAGCECLRADTPRNVNSPYGEASL